MTLPSISSRRLDRFLERYGECDQVMQAALLDSFLPSSKFPSNRAAKPVLGDLDLQEYDKATSDLRIEKEATKMAIYTGMGR
jgi:hypothetical protein